MVESKLTQPLDDKPVLFFLHINNEGKEIQNGETIYSNS